MTEDVTGRRVLPFVSDWISKVVECSTLHGVAWYSKTDNVKIRTLIVTFTVVIVFGLPGILVQQVRMCTNLLQVNLLDVQFTRGVFAGDRVLAKQQSQYSGGMEDCR